VTGEREPRTRDGADGIRAAARAWLAGDPDPSTRAELLALLDADDMTELMSRFAAVVEFGTAGMRALLGAGPARMNRAVVIRACAGLASHWLARTPDAKARGVVVACDARHMSRTFADDAAGVFAAGEWRVHRFAEPVPTPLLAFAVAHLRAAAGVMITASHNPALYNGIKIYGASGAQVIPPEDADIARAIAEAPEAVGVPRDSMEEAQAKRLLVEVGPDVGDAYVEAVGALRLTPKPRAPLTIVYTPLHGVGLAWAARALAAAGFAAPVAVPEQAMPDPRFPTAPFPNPEERGTLDLALGLARKKAADLVVANDPDADRLAVAVPGGDGAFVPLTGNQIGVLLGHHLLTARPARGERAVISTIVSSPMLGVIARALGVHYEETLTGFKWIADRALALAREGMRFVFGYEEALGYAVSDIVMDKDGISAAVVFADLAATCKSRGISVLAYLEELYRQFGLYASSQRTVSLAAESGAGHALMVKLRRAHPAHLGGRAIRAWRDYAVAAAPGGGRLPPSDVLAYELEGDTRVIVRPSGTEPKLKCYLDHREPLAQDEPLAAAEERAARAMAEIGDELPELFRA
jgi:phosphomannomutase